MNSYQKIILLIVSLIWNCSTHAEESTPSLDSLVKVTPNNNAKCVEYYTYHQEIYCSTVGEKNPNLDLSLKDREHLNIIFDDRPWQYAWGKASDDLLTLEYVPQGDNVEQWHELITSQFFPGLQEKVTPLQYAHQVLDNLKNQGFKFESTILKQSPEQVIFEFRITAPDNQQQDELQMVTTDDKGLYVLHYVIKKSDMGEENRNKWLRNLESAKIKES